MSRAVVATAYAGPEVLAIVDVYLGPPGPDQLLVDVRAAGVHPADWKTYTGSWGHDPTKLPLRLGFEAAGVVRAVGSEITDVQVGDEVIVHPTTGAYAERLLVRRGAALPKPSSLDWPQAAALLLAGTTAVHALTAVGVGAGDTLLVHGASGGVGAMVIQLARQRGARVVGTAGAANHEHVLDLGATAGTYGPGLADRLRRAAPTVSAAIDLAGTEEALEVSAELVTDRRRIATVANFGKGAQLGVHLLGHGVGAEPGSALRREARARLVELAGAGRLRVPVGATYPLAEAARAHRAGLAGTVTGKIVLLP